MQSWRKYWVLNKYFFDTLVTLILLYRVEVYGEVTSLNPLKKSLKMLKSKVYPHQETYMSSYFSRRNHVPFKSCPSKGLLNTRLRFKEVALMDFLKLDAKQAKISKRHMF